MIILISYLFSRAHVGPVAVLAFGMLIFVMLTVLATSLLRYNHLPHTARTTPGFFKQTLVFTERGLTQIARNWQGIVLDLGLNLMSGLFLGLVFYQVCLCVVALRSN